MVAFSWDFSQNVKTITFVLLGMIVSENSPSKRSLQESLAGLLSTSPISSCTHNVNNGHATVWWFGTLWGWFFSINSPLLTLQRSSVRAFCDDLISVVCARSQAPSSSVPHTDHTQETWKMRLGTSRVQAAPQMNPKCLLLVFKTYFLSRCLSLSNGFLSEQTISCQYQDSFCFTGDQTCLFATL